MEIPKKKNIYIIVTYVALFKIIKVTALSILYNIFHFKKR